MQKCKSKKNAFTLVEVLIVMGVIVVLAFLAIAAIQIALRVQRDRDRENLLAQVASEVSEFRRERLRYPDHSSSSDYALNFSVFRIGSTSIPLTGSLVSRASTSSTGTLYEYLLTEDGFVLCAELENGSIANYGTDDSCSL